MATEKDPKDKTDLQRRFLIGSSLAFAGTAASGVLTGCGAKGAAGADATTPPPASTPVAATPAFTPAAGTYSSAQNVTISSATSGAKIYYTMDGTMPTTGSTLYSAAIQVNGTKMVQALATASGFTPSSVGSAAYTIKAAPTPPEPVVATPTFSPAAGTYSSAQNVTLACTTSGAKIYYTVDGSAPTTSSAAYASPIAVSATKTVKAIAAASGDQQSAVGSAAYTISAGATPVAATPTFSPAAGTYTSAQSVSIACATSGAKIFYTVDGSTPTTSSTAYASPIGVSATKTLRAIATASGDQQSAVGSAAYTINAGATPVVATPAFTPAPGAYTSAQTVTISTATAGAAIYYTLDGSTPTTSSSRYGSPLAVASTQTVNAFATAPGDVQSATATATYTISGGALSAPANLQVINQGGPNNGPQGFYTFLGETNSTSTRASYNYQGLSWLAATPGANAIAKYNIYRNGALYDSAATPITITGYIVPGKNSFGAAVGILTVTAVSGGKTAISDGLVLPGLKLTSSASGFSAGTIISEYTTANTGAGGNGTYTVNWSQTCGSSSNPVTFTGWSYNDTAATNCNVYDFTSASTAYAYSVTAVDSQGNEGPPAYPSAYMYQGISQTQQANFSYGGTTNWTDTSGAPANGPYDIALTFPTGSTGFQPVWSGAGPDTQGCLCPVQHFECGAFNFLVFDIKVTDDTFKTNGIQYSPVMRDYGVVGGVDEVPWISAIAQDYCTPIVGEWVTCKIPFADLGYGLYNVTGSFVATSQFNGTLTVSKFGAHTAFGIDGSGYVTGPGIPKGTCIFGYVTNPSGPGPWVYTVVGPNIVGNESGTGNYLYQGTCCYKHGWRYETNPAPNTGAYFLNNIGFTTV